MLSATASPPVDRLTTLPAGEPGLTLGWAVGAWLEEWLVQPNGPRAGKPVELTPQQVHFLLWWYAVDEAGRWLFDHAARRLAKGTGKSPFAAMLALAEFCGPVRVADFSPRFPGGVVGKPVDMPLVEIAATAESQTGNTMRWVRAFAPKGSKVAVRYGLDAGKTVYYRLPEGELRVITSSSTAAEGGQTTAAIQDETHLWTPTNGGAELAAILDDNLTKSGGRAVETANAWVPGRECVANATWDAWVTQEEGGLQEGASRILYDARIAPADTDMADERSLRAALEHTYRGCYWVDIDRLVGRVWSPKAKPDDSKRKYLNWPTAAWDAWVTAEQWDRLADPTVEVADGDRVVLFFDGSKSRDATALVGCRVEDGHVFLVGVWEPPGRHDHSDWTVDPDAVDFAVRRAFDRWQVAAFFADVREWESWVYTEWPLRYRDTLEVWAVPSGRPPQPVAWDMRGHGDEFARAAEACHAEIEAGGFTHDGSSALSRHVAACRRRPFRDLITVGKESPDSPRKIDAAVCVIGARMVRRIVLSRTDRSDRKKPGRMWGA
ncbi:MAG: terminase [Acidimicrobiia bacterium]|nr:terminase [Acidimicrobiia bacterium]